MKVKGWNSWVIAILFIPFWGCSQYGKTVQGTAAGATIGAGTGAIIGSATGHAGPGIAIGAGLGALTGALVGAVLDQEDERNQALEAQLKVSQEQIEENKRLIEELKKRGADVRGTDRGVVINLPDILFEFDRAGLTPEAERTVGEITEVLRDVRGRPISVEGHTDSVGTVVYNKQLSLRRAESVAGELRRQGISETQISVTGYGEGSPIATNNSDEGRARNRRVEIIVENVPR